MEYRKIGISELNLSAITFGAWATGGWMWGSSNRKNAIEAIQAAYNEGVTSIDTAPIYGQGESEEIVGDAIKGISRDKIQILTKFGMRWDEKKGDFAFSSFNNAGVPIDIYKYAGKNSIIKECEDSLRRLGTDYIDLYQIHWPDSTTPIEESMEALALLQQQGKIRFAGVCNYSAEQLAKAGQSVNIIADQVPYSMLTRGIEEHLIPYVSKNNQAILAYSPLERGLLTGKITPDYTFEQGDHRSAHKYYTKENIERVNAFLGKIRPLAAVKNATLSQLALRWTIDQPGITIALAGARNAEQAIQNARAVHIKLSHEEIMFINQQMAAL